jgi:tetratricopeptide (TPR) repeat protein
MRNACRWISRARWIIFVFSLVVLLARHGEVTRAAHENGCYIDLARSALSNPAVPYDGYCWGQHSWEDDQVPHGWALTQILNHDLESAITWLETTDSVENEPQKSLWAAIGRVLFEQGDMARLVWSWHQAGVYDLPGMGRRAFDLGQATVEEGHPDLARPLFKAAEEMDLLDTQLRRDLARLLLDQYGDRSGAVGQLSFIGEDARLTFQETMQVAVLWRKAAKYQRAREWLLRASTLRPDSLEPRFEAATVDLFEGHYSEAEQTALDLLAADKTNARAYTLLGWAYGAQSRWEEALAAEREAIALSPESDWSYSLLGSFLASRKNYAEAEDAVRQAIALAPGEVSYVVQLADLISLKNRRVEALSLYRQALQMKGAKPYEPQIKTQVEKLSQ